MGVSTALVSYVLNGKEKEARVGKEMTKKIRKTAEKLNYRPNLIAKSLKHGRTNTIGLIVADISNPFFSAIARVIEDEASRHNFNVLMGSSDEDANKSREVAEAMLSRQIDGLIMTPTEEDVGYIKKLRTRKIPVVLIDRYFPELKSNWVASDNFQSAYNAVMHLISKGYKKIGFVTYQSDLYHFDERKKGYLQALADSNIKIKKSWILEIRYQQLDKDISVLLTRILKNGTGPNAIFFATNSLAVAGLHRINALGLKVPDEIGLVSFDESDAFDFFYAPITYIRQDISAIGTEAVKLLLQNIPDVRKSQSVIANTSLVIRKSSSGPRKE